MCYVKRGTNKKYFEAFFTIALPPSISQNKRTIVFAYTIFFGVNRWKHAEQLSTEKCFKKGTSLTDRERKVLQKKKNVFSKFMTENYCSYLRYSAETVPNKQLRTFDDHSNLNTIF